MRFTFSSFRKAAATALSLWMAAVACLTGCMLPALASGGTARIPAAQQSAASLPDTQQLPADPDEMDLMAGMENCPHASHHAPVKPGEHRPTGGSGISCCPVEVSVPPKYETPQPQLVSLSAARFPVAFNIAPERGRSAPDIAAPLDQAGRDTLLQTHLLRI